MDAPGDDRLKRLYKHLWDAHEGDAHGGDAFAPLDESLHPRSPAWLYELAHDLGLGAGDQVLDVGCGRGEHACELAQRFGCRVVGVDPLGAHVRRAAREAHARGLRAAPVAFVRGRAESLPFADGRFSWIWCHDVLVHVPDLAAASAECARVLRPGGRVLVFHSEATPALADAACRELVACLALAADALVPGAVATAFRTAGFRLRRHERVGGEWAEALEEAHGCYGRHLLRAARLLHAPEALAARLGAGRARAALGLYLWGIYHLLGQLSSRVFVFERAPG